MARLGDHVLIKTGKLDANAASPDGKYPFFTCSVTPLRIDTYSYHCECVLVAGNGDLNVKYYSGPFDAYQRTYIIESKDKDILSVPYLFYFLDKYVETLRKQSIGGVIKYIKLGNLTQAPIPIPDMQTQTSVVAMLNQVNNLIALRKQQLAKLDELVKSRFIELFGDPESNPDTVDFELAFTIRDDLRKPINGVTRSTMHAGQLYPYYGANGQVDSINEYLMDCDAICLAEDCGAYGAGEPSSYIVSGKCWVNNHAHVLLPKDCCDIEFANVYLRLLDLTEYVTGTTRLKLTQAKMKTIPMILPPLELQRQFAAFVHQTDRAKSILQQGLDKLETTKKALMQQYFG